MRTAERHQPQEVQVTTVRSRAERWAFIDLPYALHAGEPEFIPPLRMERRDFLDPAKHPWFEHGSAALFLAWKDGRIAGRIAAVDDPRFNAFHGTNEGHFGLFECEQDPAVARSLLGAVRAWHAGRGRSSIAGPYSWSSNYECGVLVDGFGVPPAPAMRTAWNPAWYGTLLEAAGLRKAKDLWAWELATALQPPEKVVRVANAVRARTGVTLRTVQLRAYAQEVERLKDIYNSAWERNWGFVPMTDGEFTLLARELRQTVVPELLLMAEVKGEPVAFSLAVPDANVALKAAGGNLTRWGLPVGLVKLLWASRSIRRLRLLTLGVKAAYRHRGLDALLYLESIQRARALGYASAELSWVLEDNDLMNRAIANLGGRRTRTWRLYEGGVG